MLSTRTSLETWRSLRFPLLTVRRRIVPLVHTGPEGTAKKEKHMPHQALLFWWGPAPVPLVSWGYPCFPSRLLQKSHPSKKNFVCFSYQWCFDLVDIFWFFVVARLFCLFVCCCYCCCFNIKAIQVLIKSNWHTYIVRLRYSPLQKEKYHCDINLKLSVIFQGLSYRKKQFHWISEYL